MVQLTEINYFIERDSNIFATDVPLKLFPTNEILFSPNFVLLVLDITCRRAS